MPKPCILVVLLLPLIALPLCGAWAPQSGVQSSKVVVQKDTYSFVAFTHAAFNNTELQLTMHCDDKLNDYEYTAQWVLRSSECEREFTALLSDQAHEAIKVYYDTPLIKASIFDYEQVLYYQSKMHKFNCETGGVMPVDAGVVDIGKLLSVYTFKNATKARLKRDINYSKLPLDAGKMSSWHPMVRVGLDAVYLLVVRIEVAGSGSAASNKHNITVELTWRSPKGYLSAVDYPLLPFYGIMCGLYITLAIVWSCVSACYWRDLLRIQYWIGGVILMGMIEKAAFYGEYTTINNTGAPAPGAMQFAEIASAAKRTLARVLIIIVSVGFGVVKPRLGSTLHRVLAVAAIYFSLSCIEANIRITKAYPTKEQEKQLAVLPLVLVDVAIFWWIFTSLQSTMRALRLRRNEVKLAMYRHFTNTLIMAVVASAIFMAWSLSQHVLNTCLKDWKEKWVNVAFWHVFFSAILIVIMVLWRPTNANQRYAFTPLLDDHSDEDDDEDTLFTDAAFITGNGDQSMKRLTTTTVGGRHKKASPNEAEAELQRDLRWVEENIPSSLADKLMADSDDDEEQMRYEMSKMQ